MIFPYRSIIAAAPDGDDYILILRPEIPVTIVGPHGAATYIGLVDTGSDNTIVPKSIADDLGIEVRKASGPAASVFGGSRVELLNGEAVLQLEQGTDSIAWTTSLCFFEFQSGEEETVILGHTGFLDYFTSAFDGKDGILTLTPNDDLPAMASEDRS